MPPSKNPLLESLAEAYNIKDVEKSFDEVLRIVGGEEVFRYNAVEVTPMRILQAMQAAEILDPEVHKKELEVIVISTLCGTKWESAERDLKLAKELYRQDLIVSGPTDLDEIRPLLSMDPETGTVELAKAKDPPTPKGNPEKPSEKSPENPPKKTEEDKEEEEEKKEDPHQIRHCKSKLYYDLRRDECRKNSPPPRNHRPFVLRVPSDKVEYLVRHLRYPALKHAALKGAVAVQAKIPVELLPEDFEALYEFTPPRGKKIVLELFDPTTLEVAHRMKALVVFLATYGERSYAKLEIDPGNSFEAYTQLIEKCTYEQCFSKVPEDAEEDLSLNTLAARSVFDSLRTSYEGEIPEVIIEPGSTHTELLSGLELRNSISDLIPVYGQFYGNVVSVDFKRSDLKTPIKKEA